MLIPAVSNRLTRHPIRPREEPPRRALRVDAAERAAERDRRIAAREAALDAALEMSFPASDPLSW